MRPLEDVRAARALLEAGETVSGTARQLGVARSTIRAWRDQVTPPSRSSCQACGHPRHELRAEASVAYAYLLGAYLGDGHLTRNRAGVYRLSVYCDAVYPGIIDEIAGAIEEVIGVAPGRHRHHVTRCIRVSSYSKQWPCWFPQHGPGRKHTRPIVLLDWQREIVDRDPRPFLRGLIHSDGCRTVNRIRTPKREYAYPRYLFTNESADIAGLFSSACQSIGVEARRMNRRTQSVNRRDDVAKLDEFIGPKA